MVATTGFRGLAAVGLLTVVLVIAWIPAVSFLHAALLMFAARWQLDRRLRYWDAYRVSIVANVVCSVLGTLVSLPVMAIGGMLGGLGGVWLGSQGVWVVICGWIYRKWLRISFGEAVRVAFAQLLVFLAVMAGIFLIVIAAALLLDYLWER